MQSSLWNRITAWRITVRSFPNLYTIYPCSISINNCTHPEPGLECIKVFNLFCSQLNDFLKPEEAGTFYREVCRNLNLIPAINSFIKISFRSLSSTIKFVIPGLLIFSHFLLLGSSTTFCKIFNSLIQVGLFIAHFFKSLTAKPGSNWRTTLTCINNSYRHIEFF